MRRGGEAERLRRSRRETDRRARCAFATLAPIWQLCVYISYIGERDFPEADVVLYSATSEPLSEHQTRCTYA